MEKVGPYVIIGRLATGGMAEVFLARRDGPAGFEKIQVVKRILPQFAEDPEFRRMFLDEARLAALINHPNVVQIFELGGTRELLYIAMEYVPGFDLAKVMDASLKMRRLVPPAVSARIVADAAAGLDFASRLTDAKGQPRGIVHRDISPENLLVSEVGQVKVVDFGIARANTGAQLSASGRLKGKVHYHAPEHIQNKPVDGKADVYALGVVLYELLCARRPFEGLGELEVMRNTVEVDPPPPSKWYPTAEPELSQIALRALAREPKARPTAGQLRDELEVWLRTNPCTAADVERYLLEVIPAGSADRLKARKLLESAPMRQPGNTDPSRVAPLPPGVREPGATEHTVREALKRWQVLAPVGAAALLAFGAVGWMLTRPPPALPPAPVKAPEIIAVPVPPPPLPNEVAVPPPANPPPAPKLASEHDASHHPYGHRPAGLERAGSNAAYLIVKVSPPCELRVDKESGERPLGKEFAIAPGTHELHFTNAKLHLDARRTVKLEPGQHEEPKFEFVKHPVAMFVAPWAYVTVDGENYGSTPTLNKKVELYEGAHAVELRNPSYKSATTTLSMTDKPTTFKYAFQH
ncbi:MAG: serine/threonine protein kinase [Deltaproteobacteria bacterium]|nr:serine/threonine protein kinase [Deltaproteobacteria bacterium]